VSTHKTPRNYPPIIESNRFVRNGVPVQAALVRQLVESTNHSAGRREKVVFQKCKQLDSILESDTADTELWHFGFHSGYNAFRLSFDYVLAAWSGDEVDPPYCYWAVTDGWTGGSTVNTENFSSQRKSTVPSDVPQEFRVGRVSVDIEPNTAYRCVLHGVNDARIVSCSAVVVYNKVADDADTGVVDQGLGTMGSPILSAHTSDLVASVNALWNRNAVHLFSWSSDRESASLTRAGTSQHSIWAAGVTVVSAITKGFTVDTTGHNRLTGTSVPVFMAVRAERTVGSGDASVTLKSASGNHITISGITTEGWYTTTGTIPIGETKFAFHHFTDGAGTTIRTDAAVLFEYA